MFPPISLQVLGCYRILLRTTSRVFKGDQVALNGMLTCAVVP